MSREDFARLRADRGAGVALLVAAGIVVAVLCGLAWGWT